MLLALVGAARAAIREPAAKKRVELEPDVGSGMSGRRHPSKTQLYLTERLGRLFRAIGAGRRRSDRVATGGSATRSRRRAAAFSNPAATLAPMTSFEWPS